MTSQFATHNSIVFSLTTVAPQEWHNRDLAVHVEDSMPRHLRKEVSVREPLM